MFNLLSDYTVCVLYYYIVKFMYVYWDYNQSQIIVQMPIN